MRTIFTGLKSPLQLKRWLQRLGNPRSIKGFLLSGEAPPYHKWPHTTFKKTEKSKPYCLRMNGPDSVGLDWEDSVLGAVEMEFRRRGFQTARELGTNEHLESLCSVPDLAPLTPGNNERDLWALRADSDSATLFILEGKGRVAAALNDFLEGLGQLFPGCDVKSRPNSMCWPCAKKIHDAWMKRGLKPTVVVGLVVPEWHPDVVWRDGTAKRIKGSLYERQLGILRNFLATGEVKGTTDLENRICQIETDFQIRALTQSTSGLCFRLITTRHDQGFEITGLDLSS